MAVNAAACSGGPASEEYRIPSTTRNSGRDGPLRPGEQPGPVRSTVHHPAQGPGPAQGTGGGQAGRLSQLAGLHGLDPPDEQAGVERGEEHGGQVRLADPPDNAVTRLDHQATGLHPRPVGFRGVSFGPGVGRQTVLSAHRARTEAPRRPGRQRHGRRGVPGDQHDRGPLGCVLDLRREPPHPVLVQATARFVEDQQIRRPNESLGDQRPLQIAPRKCPQRPGCRVRQPEPVEQVIHLDASLVAGQARGLGQAQQPAADRQRGEGVAAFRGVPHRRRMPAALAGGQQPSGPPRAACSYRSR